MINPVYLRLIWNSVALLLPILTGQFVIAPLAAYGFWQWKWKYKEGLFFVYMIVMLMPMQLTLVPHYLVTGWPGIRHSWWAIILPAVFHPLGVFLIRQQIKEFPEECLEAARLDGAGEFQIYRKIIVDQAVVFIKDSYKFPMSVYLSQSLDGEAIMYYAASVVYMLPALFAFLMAKEYLIEGISMSGVKS
ncbi:carbohydrate ABC transporter permease [Lachnospiraceae bacterium 54-11]